MKYCLASPVCRRCSSAEIFALLILFAGFFSAVLLALTSFARSFKEAQAYLIPVMLLSLAPGLISLTPGVEFNALLAVTPLLNIVLLARDLFEGSVDPTLATAAVLTTALYALAAIGLAARVFGTDAILYGSEASWSDLFRRPPRARPVPSVSGAMFCLALLFPGCFLLRGLLAQTALRFAVQPACFQRDVDRRAVRRFSAGGGHRADGCRYGTRFACTGRGRWPSAVRSC